MPISDTSHNPSFSQSCIKIQNCRSLFLPNFFIRLIKCKSKILFQITALGQQPSAVKCVLMDPTDLVPCKNRSPFDLSLRQPLEFMILSCKGDTFSCATAPTASSKDFPKSAMSISIILWVPKKIINNLQFPRLFGGELKIPKIQRIFHSFVPKQHCGFQPAKGSRLFEKFLRNVAVPPDLGVRQS